MLGTTSSLGRGRGEPRFSYPFLAPLPLILDFSGYVVLIAYGFSGRHVVGAFVFKRVLYTLFNAVVEGKARVRWVEIGREMPEGMGHECSMLLLEAYFSYSLTCDARL